MNDSVLTLSRPVARIVFPFLASSIRLAHGLDSAKWSLSPRRETVRLNVGFCEIATFHEDWARILVDRATAPAIVSKSMTAEYLPKSGAKPFYKTAPGSALVVLEWTSPQGLKSALQALQAAHHAVVRSAIRFGFNRGSRAGHSNDAVLTVERELKIALPRPSYASDDFVDERWEGAAKRTTTVRYERDSVARLECLRYHGAACAICGLLFEQRYGPEARGLIHVHHLKPIARNIGRRRVNPTVDLRPVCPNCHAVIHSRPAAFSIEDVKKMMKKSPGW